MFKLGFVCFLMLGLAAGVGGCGNEEAADQVVESVGEAAEQAVGTAGAEVGSTVEAKADEVGGTLESKSGVVKETVESAVEQVDEVVTDLKGVFDRLDGWTEDVLTALGTLGDQATALRSDPSLIADSGWRAETEEAVASLAQRAADASEIAAELEDAGKLPAIREILGSLGETVGEAAVELEDHLQSDDSLAFLKSTEELERVKLTLDMLVALIETARN